MFDKEIIKNCILYHGDCFENMKSMPDNMFNLILTDIPYGLPNYHSSKRFRVDRGNANIVSFKLDALVKELIRLASESIYIFCGKNQISGLCEAMADAGMTTRLLIWEKTNPCPMHGKIMWLSGIESCVYGRFSKATFNGCCKNTVLRYPLQAGIYHPTQKPIKLMEELLLTSSNTGDTVFDPFMGAGTTGIVAVKHGRKFIGIEREQEYFDISCKRIEAEYQNRGLLDLCETENASF